MITVATFRVSVLGLDVAAYREELALFEALLPFSPAEP